MKSFFTTVRILTSIFCALLAFTACKQSVGGGNNGTAFTNGVQYQTATGTKTLTIDDIKVLGGTPYDGTTAVKELMKKLLEDIKDGATLTFAGDAGDISSTFYTDLSAALTGTDSDKTYSLDFSGMTGADPDELKLTNTKLSAIKLPTDMKTIHEGAFISCLDLTEVIIPNSVTSIEDTAFAYCENLTTVTIPNSVTEIGAAAFGACGLTEVIIPNSVTSIEDTAFAYCKALTEVIIPDGVTMIDYAAFKESGLKTVTIPNSVTEIGLFAFSGCENLTEVIIPDGVTMISQEAFSGCKALTEVIIPDGVTMIDYAAFKESGLKTVTIPNSVTEIGQFAFAQAVALHHIKYGGTTVEWKKITFGVGVWSFVPATEVTCTDGTVPLT